MATRSRNIAPAKVKVISPSHTPTTKLKATPNHPSKPNASTAPPQKQISSHLRPTTRTTTTTDVSKQQGKKPASTDTAHKPTQARTKSIDKKLSPAQKTRVSTNASLQSSSLSGKTVDSQKLVPGKNLKTPTKDAGRLRLSRAAPVSNVKKSSVSAKKQETESAASAAKEQMACTPHEEVENFTLSSVHEPETQAHDQEFYIAHADEEKTVQVVGNDEKVAADHHLLVEDHEPLDIAKTETEVDHTDAKIVISESSTSLEHHEITPLDIKTQDSDNKCYNEETSNEQHELKEHSMNETNTCDKPESHHEEVVEEEIKEEEEAEEEQETAALSKKDEARSESEAHESEETEGQEVVVEKKQESENAATKRQERKHGKKDAALSNDVIEVTASKLREQRKNKVRALAGAFETVISLQETK